MDIKHHILVVEDDDSARRKISHRLLYAGYYVTQAADGETALDMLESDIFDVVVTDIVMGAVDGIEVMHTARSMTYRPAVILLTGHGSLETCIDALRAGAYDYLLKPCSPEHLLSCVEGAIQRHTAEQKLREVASVLAGQASAYEQQNTPTSSSEAVNTASLQSASRSNPLLHIGDLKIGESRHEVWFQEERVRLTPIEYALIFYLAERPGQVCSCRDIVRYTHGLDANNADAQSLVKAHVQNLRKKLTSAYIVNDRGSGYMLVIPDDIE